MIRTVATCGMLTSVKFQMPCRETAADELVRVEERRQSGRRIEGAVRARADQLDREGRAEESVAGPGGARPTCPPGSACRSSRRAAAAGRRAPAVVWKKSCGADLDRVAAEVRHGRAERRPGRSCRRRAGPTRRSRSASRCRRPSRWSPGGRRAMPGTCAPFARLMTLHVRQVDAGRIERLADEDLDDCVVRRSCMRSIGAGAGSAGRRSRVEDERVLRAPDP